MDIARGDDEIPFDAIIGNFEDLVDSPSVDAQRLWIRVQLDGDLAAHEDSSALAAELEELAQEFVTEVVSRKAVPSPQDSTPAVSIRGIELEVEDAAALKERLLEHVRLRAPVQSDIGTDER